MFRVGGLRRQLGVWVGVGFVFVLVRASWGLEPLVQLPGTTGCVSDDGSGPCVLGKELDGAIGVAVSPDSRNVYVTSQTDAAVAVFTIDPGTGQLTQSPSQDGCVSESGSALACEDGRALLQV